MVFQLGFEGPSHNIRMGIGNALVVCDLCPIFTLWLLFSLKGWDVPKSVWVKKPPFHALSTWFLCPKTIKSLRLKFLQRFKGILWMRRFTKISLSTLNNVAFHFSLKNEHNCQITDIFKKTDKLSVLLNYTSIITEKKIWKN